ncbi:pyridoxamine 5'-phosphate oxidase family protein, partial [Methylogaea oryzae]|uniref:pyridoxamine 5'-phosphate oxidase family protein n=1 Tax=Methylogaea oryzae TaxID=1295382 RepID=UPI00278BFFB4
FSEPSTHRTLQVKGRDGAIAALDDGDLRRIAFYREAFLLEISALGFNPTIARSLLHCPDDDITAVAFTVAEAYTQTPGPDARTVAGRLVKLDAIRDCLEGVIPGLMATCAPDGMPNVACLSQVEYVDGEHLALSYQFFNTTRGNILANPQARLIVTHPRTGARYRLLLRYLRTETEGALFERMKAKLAGIASHTGMSDVFRLLGSDVYRVLEIEP